jgi:hypothetical protein
MGSFARSRIRTCEACASTTLTCPRNHLSIRARSVTGNRTPIARVKGGYPSRWTITELRGAGLEPARLAPSELESLSLTTRTSTLRLMPAAISKRALRQCNQLGRKLAVVYTIPPNVCSRSESNRRLAAF